jgi:hypothetical protein
MSRLPRDLTLLPDLLPDAAPAGPGADAQARLSGPAPAMRHELPGGENIQAWPASTRAGEHQQGWQQLTADNPSPTIYGRAPYCPSRAQATAPSWTARSRSIRSSGSRPVNQALPASPLTAGLGRLVVGVDGECDVNH